MRIAKPRVQHVQGCRPRAIHYAAQAETEEPFCRASALIWRQTSEKRMVVGGGGEKGRDGGWGVRIWMH